MSNRPWLRFSFGFGLVSMVCAPALAQSQAELVNRTQATVLTLCANTSDPILSTRSCAISGGGQQAQNALTVSPREQTAASSTATQTTDTQVALEAEELAAERAKLLGDGHAQHEAGVSNCDDRLRGGDELTVEIGERLGHAIGGRRTGCREGRRHAECACHH